MDKVHVPVEVEAACLHISALLSEFRTRCINATPTVPSTSTQCKVTLGRLVDREFDSHVPRVFFLNTLRMLGRYENWKSVVRDACSHDYFYPVDCTHNVRRRSSTTNTSHEQLVRSSTSFMSAPNKLATEHTYAEVVGVSLLHVEDESDDTTVDVQVRIQKIHSVLPKILPKFVQPLFVRLRRQTVFNLENWRFVFTQEWSAPSRADAEQKLGKGDAVYKIKMEFTGSRDYLLSLPDNYLAVSLLLKICSLLGGNILTIFPYEET